MHNFFLCSPSKSIAFSIGGVSTRSRSVIRQAVKPHGQCLSDLVERRSCSLDPCYSFSASVVDDKVVCIRSDGLLVEGKHQNVTSLR